MNFNDYQCWTRTTAIYPDEMALEYTVLGLLSEAGEVAGKLKKIIRDGDATGEKREALAAELGDCVWYLARLADELGVDLETIAAENMVKLNSRKERGVISGSGDNR